MKIFGIGLLELVFLLLLALVIFGPKDLQKMASSLGHTLNKWVSSELGQTIFSFSRRARTLPQTLMREAAKEKAALEKEIGLPEIQPWVEDAIILPSPDMPAGDEPVPQVPPDPEPPVDE
jgi:sec-independent protein translocase protein TatA